MVLGQQDGHQYSLAHYRRLLLGCDEQIISYLIIYILLPYKPESVVKAWHIPEMVFLLAC